MNGPTIDSLREGMAFSFEEKITIGMVDAFASLSGDFNPLHMDEDFARERGYRQRVVHGELLGALFSRLVGMYCPGRNALLHSMNLRFRNPAYPGTIIRVSGEIEQVSVENKVVVMKLEAVDAVDCTIYATGKAQAGFLPRREEI